MITTVIGRTFLNAFNNTTNQKLSAKEFFEKEYFELFFNSSKYMQWVTNSPFVQMKKGQKVETINETERREKLQNLHDKIQSGVREASIALGFPASEEDEYATTSGLVTDINIKYEDDDIYLTWIGSGLGIGVAGGYSIFFDNEQILLSIFEGWKIYRKFLNDKTLERMRGNQINTWNGQWLYYRFDKYYEENPSFTYLEKYKFFFQDKEKIEVNTIEWNKLFFNLSRQFSETTITGYVYSFGQTNKTLGFYPFKFHQATKLLHIYKKLFGENAALQDKDQYEQLYGIHIKRACELGAIGLQALEPKDLRKYFGNTDNLNLTKPEIKIKKGESPEKFDDRNSISEKKDNDNLIKYKTYKTWLLAMITKNKEEELNYTKEIAKALYEYRKADKAGSKKRANIVESNLLSAKTKRLFLETLTEIIKEVDKKELEIFSQLRDKVHLMSNEDYGYFIVLIKFDYAYQERIS